MGIIIAKFRKKKTTVEILEKLDKEIKAIEDFGRNTEQRHKKIVGQFLIFSIGVYLFSAFLFYFYFYPSNIKDRLLYLIPLVLAPVLIFSSKKLLTWYYNRKLSKNQNTLIRLRDDKKKLLEKVMDTETYKVARGILEKYAPEQVRKVQLSTDGTPMKQLSLTPNPQAGLRQRVSLGARPQPTQQQARLSFGSLQQTPTRPFVNPSSTAQFTASRPSNSLVPVNSQVVPAGGPAMARAILPKDRSILDKMVEYLVGDGPSNRFALICTNCSGHNGMAVKEEFEYLSFRCCYCYTFNQSRKKRPLAPKIEFDSSQPTAGSETSESEKNSGSESEDEVLSAGEPKTKTIETLYTNEQAKTSDNEHASDFDKLSDLDLKNSDSENLDQDESTSNIQGEKLDFDKTESE